MIARLSPFAPVGGTMWAASPARKQPPVLHRLGDEAAHAGHALLENRALGELPSVERDPGLQLLPDPVVGPERQVLVGVALDVVARELAGAQAQEREAALVGRVADLVDRGRDRSEDPEPAERILARELGQHAVRNARAADPVEAVAARDHVALDLLPRPLVGERQQRPLGLEVGDGHAGDLEQQRPARLQPRLDQILDDLGLAVDDDRLAHQLLEVDPVPLAVELDPDPRVDLPVALHPPAHTGLDEQVGGPLLEHARADPRLDVLAAPVLDHDGVDALQVEQVREHQAGRAGTDDPDLGSAHADSSASTCCAIANAEFATGTPA